MHDKNATVNFAVAFLHPLLAHFIRAAHALIALAGMAVAVRADADRLQLAVVLLVVMAAGSHGAVNGLVVHRFSLHVVVVMRETGAMRPQLLSAKRGEICALRFLVFACVHAACALEKTGRSGYNKIGNIDR